MVLPDSLTQLGEVAFLECTSLTSVVLPDSLTHMGERAFVQCTSLTSVVLPDSLTQLGMGAFVRCSSLTSVVLPDSLTQLGECAFGGCSSLMSVVLPDSAELCDYVFEGCSSLHSVVLPDSTELGDHVFLKCDALEQKAAMTGFDTVELYLRDRYKCVILRKYILRLLGKYNQAVNEANGTEAEKHAIALANFPTQRVTRNRSLDVGLFLQTMNASGGNGIEGLVGYILKFV